MWGLYINGNKLIDGASNTELTFATNKDLDKFLPGDTVTQDSGYTPVTSEITKVEEVDGAWALHSTAEDSCEWHSITYGNGLYTAFGQTGSRFMYSPDGVTWTLGTPVSPNDAHYYGSCYGNGRFVAVSSNSTARVVYSDDGMTWHKSDVVSSPNDTQWMNVVYGNNKYVAVAKIGTYKTLYSDDAISWTAGKVSDMATQFFGLAYGGGRFVAVGKDGTKNIMYSDDGESWTQITAPENNWWQSVAYGNGKFVAVAKRELIE